MPDVSIAIAAKDSTEALRGIQRTVEPLNKGIGEVQSKLDVLSRTKVTLNIDFGAAQKELAGMQLAFAEVKTSAGNLQNTNLSVDHLTGELGSVGSTARVARSELKDTLGMFSKATAQIGTGPRDTLAGLGKRMRDAGALDWIEQAGLQAADLHLKSALGQADAAPVSGAMSGALSGAAMGTAIGGPGVGTLVGAVAGGLLGAAQGAMQENQAKDDAFKAYVKEQAEARFAERDEMVVSGSAEAAQREDDRIIFSQMLGEEAAGSFQRGLEDRAKAGAVQYGELAVISKSMRGYDYDERGLLSTLDAVSSAGLALGMDTGQMAGIAQALGSIKNMGTVTDAALAGLHAYGIDAYGILAAAHGTSREALKGQAARGELGGSATAADLITGIDAAYSPAAQARSQSFSGLSARLASLEREQQNAAGEGFNETRSAGLEKQIEWYGGESGTKMEEVNRAMGAFAASQENDREGRIRGAMDVMMASDEFVEAQKTANNPEASTEEQQAAWAKMGEVLARAKTVGINQYNASEGAQLMRQSEEALIGEIREDASADQAYWDAGYARSQNYSKGLAAGMLDANIRALANGAVETLDPKTAYYQYGITPTGHAAGLPRVPYDNYPALLHQGERVLTAREARQQDAGSAGSVVVNVSGLTVREEADIGKVAQELARLITLGKAARAPQ
ncbi:hypothetical protein LI291_11755 [Intestinibacillus massiliensis]|nr:hypothetical protein [Intestinibacillus massiliensis]